LISGELGLRVGKCVKHYRNIEVKKGDFKRMIDYSKVSKGDILKIVGNGAPGFAQLGDLVRITEVHLNSVKVENRDGETAEFMYNCGAARLEPTEYKTDYTCPGNIPVEEKQ
jgi:hypothetical protein